MKTDTECLHEKRITSQIQVVLIALVIFCALSSVPDQLIAQDFWQQATGPGGGTVHTFAVSGSDVFAGTDGGVFLSTNNGLSWIPANSTLVNTDVSSLTISGSNLFAGSYGNVLLSTNSGASWTSVSAGLPLSYVNALVADGGNLFAGTYGNGILVSTNNGTSWTAANTGLGDNFVYALAVSGSSLYAGTNGGVFLSTNMGANWNAVNTGLTNNYVRAFAVVGSNLFAGTSGGGVFLSTDNGSHWTAVNAGLTNYSVAGLAASGSTLIAGTASGGFVSSNNGTSWTYIGSFQTPYVNAVAISGTAIFLGTDLTGIFVSMDNGSTLAAANFGLTNTAVNALAMSGSNLFGAVSGGIHVSSDGGSNWEYVPGGQRLAYYSIVSAGQILCAGSFDGVNVSTDGGSSWNPTILNLGFVNINALAINSTTLFAGTSGNLGVFRSTDYGSTWTSVGGGMPSVAVNSFAVKGAALFAGTSGSGVFRSTNNGASWAATNTGLTSPYVGALAVLDTILFAETFQGVFRSTNNGANWTAVNAGLSNNYVRAFTVAGSNLFAGTDVGVFRSTDYGSNWTAISSTGLSNQKVQSLAVNLNGQVVAGTNHSGAFKTTQSFSAQPLIRLRFPLLNSLPSSASISSVLDHVHCPYRKDMRTAFVDFLNERGGEHPYEWSKFGTKLYAAFKKGSTDPYLPGYNYYQNNKNSKRLWYLGHPGYDYPVVYGTNVYAVAPGKVSYPSGFGYSLKQSANSFATLTIDHRPTPGFGTGYISYYLHLSTHPEYIKLGIDPPIAHDGDIISQAQVDAGLVIAKSGSTSGGKKGGTGKHLHYELHWVNAQGRHIIVDPYGWNPGDATPDPLFTNSYNNNGDDRPASDKGKWLWLSSPPTIIQNTPLAMLNSHRNLNTVSQSTYADWAQKNSPTAEPLLGVDFPSSSIGYAVGLNGTIIKTSDGGENWQSILTAPSSDYAGVRFTSSTNGFAVGRNVILQTTDGGNTWIQRWLIPGQASLFDTVNNVVFLQDVSFPSQSVGYIAGAYLNTQNVSPVFLKTTDGGISWTAIADYFATGNYDEKYLQSSYFFNDSVGFVILASSLYPQNDSDAVIDSTQVLKTTDGGATWYEGSGGELSDYASNILFVSPDTGYIVGSGTIFKTTNGSINLPDWYADSLFPGSLQALSKTPDNFIGVGLIGNIISSPNGNTWSFENSGTQSNLFSINSRNGVVCAVGDSGTILIRQTSVTSTFQLADGWNMVSNPLIVSNNAKPFLFPTATSNAFAYKGSYVTAESLMTGQGYWLKFPASQGIGISGVPTTLETVAVAQRWNMIGSISMPIPVTSITSIPPNIVTSNFFAYAGAYFIADTITPGQAYWVKTNQNGSIILSTGSSQGASNRIRILATTETPPAPPASVGTKPRDIPFEYSLEQNYPNPFNPSTLIKYALPSESRLTLEIFDLLGRRVALLFDGTQQAGYHEILWTGSSDIGSGVYYYRLKAGDFIETKKLLLLR